MLIEERDGESLDISVIICTRNRCLQLRMALQSLVSVKVPAGMDWEVIVVNNQCTDATDDVLAMYAQVIPLKRTFCAKGGLAAARNAGLAAARGNVIAMTDDDCIVHCEWLANIQREFSADTRLAALGGRVERFNPLDLPLTVQTSRVRQEVNGTHSISLFDLLVVPGCNMAFSKATLDRVGAFDERLGAGTASKAAEDTDMLYRVLCLGKPIFYCPDVLVFHDHGRRTTRDAMVLRRGYAIGRGSFYSKHMLRGDIQAIWLLFQEVQRALSLVVSIVVAQGRWLLNVCFGMLLRAGGR